MRYSVAVILVFGLATIPVGCRSDAGASDEEAAIAATSTLPEKLRVQLEAEGWKDFTGDELAIWVSVARQRLVGIRGDQVHFIYVCSTAAKGTGSEANSNKTPLGWHCIDERYGDGLPHGAVFKERQFTQRVWTPENQTKDDLILSRILWLRGLEEGLNSGPGIDSHARYIYIHGTPDESELGRPVSMGCIRLSNEDVISLFDQTRTGTRVLITQW